MSEIEEEAFEAEKAIERYPALCGGDVALIEGIIERARRCKDEAGDGPVAAYHTTAGRFSSASRKIVDACVKYIFEIDPSAPPLWTMSRQEGDAASRTDLPELKTVSASKIAAMELPPLDEVIPGIGAVGTLILGARPKVGKTFMVLDWGVAVAAGGKALGTIRCEQGDALLCLFEDNAGRVQRRLSQILGDAPVPARLTIAFQDENSRRIDTGLVEQIRRWCAAAKKPRLVAIDTLTAVKPLGFDRRSVFQAEYETAAPLTKLAHELGVLIVVVHHLRKMKADGDPIEELSGTHGLSAAVDTVAGLSKTTGGYALAGRGRDVEEFEWGMSFAGGRWTKVGSAEEMRMTGERQRAMAALRRSGEWIGPADVGKETGQKPDAARRMLDRMIHDGEPVERDRGRYRAKPDQAEMPLDGGPSTRTPETADVI